MVMANHLHEQLFPRVFAYFALTKDQRERSDAKPPALARNVSDGAFIAAVNAVAQKYLYGQAVLAISVEEKCGWAAMQIPKSALNIRVCLCAFFVQHHNQLCRLEA